MSTLNFDYNDLLYVKMQHELMVFLEDLKEMPTAEAIECSYEKVIKEELVCLCEEHELPQNEAKALYEMENSLDGVYQQWLQTDSGIHQILTGILSETATREFASAQNNSMSIEPVLPNEIPSLSGHTQT